MGGEGLPMICLCSVDVGMHCSVDAQEKDGKGLVNSCVPHIFFCSGMFRRDKEGCPVDGCHN